MILLSLIYLWLAEPMGFQKVAAVHAKIDQLARSSVLPEHRHFMRRADCTLDLATTRKFADANDLQESHPLGGGNDDVFLRGAKVYNCRIPNPCRASIDVTFAHQSFMGVVGLPYESFDIGFPFMEAIGAACPEMLTDPVRKVLDERREQGG